VDSFTKKNFDRNNDNLYEIYPFASPAVGGQTG